jgi:hypothetical protein
VSNPLDDLYASIWNTLESKDDFTALFPSGSSRQVRYDTAATYAPDPDLDELQPADYPRCRVTMQSAQPAKEGDSATSFMDVTLAIEICTGSQHQTLARAATWACYRAMTTWRAYVRELVKWNDAECVADFNAVDNGFTDKDKERNRGTNQWIVVWSTVAKLYFQTTDLESL